MEIERKYLITHIPFDIAGYPFHQIEQAYLSTAPVVRVRQEDDTYYLTYQIQRTDGAGGIQSAADEGIL